MHFITRVSEFEMQKHGEIDFNKNGNDRCYAQESIKERGELMIEFNEEIFKPMLSHFITNDEHMTYRTHLCFSRLILSAWTKKTNFPTLSQKVLAGT